MLISSQAFAPKQTLVLLDKDQAKFHPLLINSIRKWSKRLITVYCVKNYDSAK